jgi:hypothetical protein
MLRALKRARSAIRRHSIKGLLPLVVPNLKHAWRSVYSGSPAIHSDFDERFHVETEHILEVGKLDVDSPNAKYAVRYQPSSPDLVRNILSRLNICYPEFTFIDFGAGKGRVLLVSSEFSFARVIGIEFSPELVRTARKNIDNYAGTRRMAPIETVCADVSTYELPPIPLVCYLYNPFQRPMMDRLAGRLCASSKAFPRDIFVIYVQAEHREVFDGSDVWTCCIDEPLFVVYRSRPAS